MMRRVAIANEYDARGYQTPGSGVERAVVPEYALLVERQPARRREIRRYVRPQPHALVQLDQSRAPLFDSGHRVRICIAQPRDDLEHRQIDIRQRAADEESRRARVSREDALEVAQEFRQALPYEIGRALFRLPPLLLVVHAGAERVVAVVH